MVLFLGGGEDCRQRSTYFGSTLHWVPQVTNHHLRLVLLLVGAGETRQSLRGHKKKMLTQRLRSGQSVCRYPMVTQQGAGLQMNISLWWIFLKYLWFHFRGTEMVEGLKGTLSSRYRKDFSAQTINIIEADACLLLMPPKTPDSPYCGPLR